MMVLFKKAIVEIGSLTSILYGDRIKVIFYTQMYAKEIP